MANLKFASLKKGICCPIDIKILQKRGSIFLAICQGSAFSEETRGTRHGWMNSAWQRHYGTEKNPILLKNHLLSAQTQLNLHLVWWEFLEEFFTFNLHYPRWADATQQEGWPLKQYTSAFYSKPFQYPKKPGYQLGVVLLFKPSDKIRMLSDDCGYLCGGAGAQQNPCDWKCLHLLSRVLLGSYDGEVVASDCRKANSLFKKCITNK